MSIQEIRTAIGNLDTKEKAVLMAELFAMNAEPNEADLGAALDRGMADVQAGRVRPIEDVKTMIPQWTSKS
jgi:predicted transcriptional regulator